MTAIPYILLALPVVDLAISNPDAGELLLTLCLLSISWKFGWLRR